MAFLVPLAEARKWLRSHQSPDGGWGVTPGQATSLVNTAEALYVLAAAGDQQAEVDDALAYFRSHLDLHLRKRGRRTRFVAFPLFALAGSFPEYDPEFITDLAGLLLEGRNNDSGWGFDLADQKSDLFSTFLAVEGLRSVPGFEEEVSAAGRWVLSAAGTSGWALHCGQGYSLTATALAVQILSHAKYADTPACKVGRELLLAATSFENEQSVIAGTPWVHCRATAIIRALTLTDTEPFHPTLAEAIRVFNRRMIAGSGWGETQGANAPTVRSQFWATHALQLPTERFDVAIHVPRVAAERMQGTLVEPTHLPFLTNSAWHFIVPAKGFRVFVYLLIATGLFLLADFKLALPRWPPWLGPAVGIMFLASAAFLVRRRPKQFNRTRGIVTVVLAGLALVHAAYGWSASDVSSGVRRWVGKETRVIVEVMQLMVKYSNNKSK